MLSNNMGRRRYVYLAVLAGGGAVAGCLGDEDDAPETAEDPDPEAEEDPDPEADDERDPDDAPDDDTEDETARGLGSVFESADSFEMEGAMEVEGETTEMSGRFHRGDMYWELRMEGQTMEWYVVDGQTYFVMQGQCFEGTMEEGPDQDDVDPDTFESEAMEHPELEPIGTDTIGGEEVLVFELAATEAANRDETMTYYVLADSGYLRRIESETMQWDYTSWGEIGPIEEPDMDCQEMPGGTGEEGGY